MYLSFSRTVHALADALVRERCGATQAERRGSPDTVARFLLEQHGRMPDYLRLPFKCLTLVFDGWGVVTAGRPFHRLPHERRWRQIETWKGSSLGFRRNLMKFFETLTVFGRYSEAYPRDTSPVAANPSDHDADHQERHLAGER